MDKNEIICIAQIVLYVINIIFKVDWLIYPMLVLMVISIKESLK